MYGVGQGFLCADNDERLLCPGDPGIDKIPLEHHVMIHHYRHHYYGIFGSLGFVYSCGIGVDKLVQLCYVIFYAPAVKVYLKRPVCLVYGLYDPDIAVKDFLN